MAKTFDTPEREKESSVIKLLAIVGSQREYGNSFLLTKETLKPLKEINYEIIQLAKKEITFCNLCGKCESMECPLEDDFNEILKKLKEADGIIFAYPKYLFKAPTKLLCFLERLDLIHHFRKHPGYSEELRLEQNVSPPLEGKHCCLFVVTDPGENAEECLNLAANEVKSLGMKLILYNSQLGAHATGKFRGEVLRDQKGIEDCRKLVRKLIDSISSKI
ncbi:flavodoxin family protein [Candidatus Bathyarchaeota archaeon]|nr:flavodoxin family protein [Candidatus Bathyarchaeota archaeon]